MFDWLHLELGRFFVLIADNVFKSSKYPAERVSQKQHHCYSKML
ncbi:MAG: hypothetical protein [Olavius algarvensis spirochete endosymbiont]|nr:MAG: hypothetical protein [Olavius algarvensis spirochete endosymbiont]